MPLLKKTIHEITPNIANNIRVVYVAGFGVISRIDWHNVAKKPELTILNYRELGLH
jgi:hypothetical protein